MKRDQHFGAETSLTEGTW